MSDLTQTCCERECGAAFVISEGEQAYFVQNNLQLPRRCRECRERRKAARLGSPASAPSAPMQTPPAPVAVFNDGRGDRGHAPAKKRRRWENDEESDYSGRRR